MHDTRETAKPYTYPIRLIAIYAPERLQSVLDSGGSIYPSKGGVK